MPKKPSRNKRGKTPMSSRTGPKSVRVHSVKDLLSRALPSLKGVTEQAQRQNFWNQWLSMHLSPDIREHVSGIAEQDGELVIFASSAAWSARLRYTLGELEGAIRKADPRVASVAVRVLPRA